jgi:Cu2+-exporting ATPase
LPAQPFPVVVDGVEQPTCCRGCQAVAQTIVGSGLSAYYLTRSSLPVTPQASEDVLQRLGLYDLPDVQRGFVVSRDDASDKDAALLLSGIACPACAWLIERKLAALPGVRAVHVNYANCRARVRWDDDALRLSSILAAVETLGYQAAPYDSARADEPLQEERRRQLWRLFVAGCVRLQVMM